MARSSATTVEQYLAELPEERRAVIAQVRDVVRKNLPKGYEETMNWGAITWEIPLSRYPKTYNGQPLAFVSLAAQKNYYALYLMCLYDGTDRAKQFAEDFRKAGKKLDMGKSCVRFKRLEDLHLPAIATVIAGTPPEKYIALYEKSRAK